MNVPGRVLLDTNIVNFILDWGEVIHDGGAIERIVSERDAEDILALRNIWITAQRASWQLAVSPRTYAEISATTDAIRRRALETWFQELRFYWRQFFKEDDLSDFAADSLARRLVPSAALAVLSDFSDRELLAHAVAYGCDAMCTRDRKTILRHQNKLRLVPVRIFTPTEWWAAISKDAAIWV